jgi:hypothetical protein
MAIGSSLRGWRIVAALRADLPDAKRKVFSYYLAKIITEDDNTRTLR